MKIHKQPPINQKLRPRHITAQVLTRQEDRRPRQIRRHARPPQRDPALHVPALLRVREVRLVELRLDGARQERVAPDAVLAQRDGRALHEAQHAGLCGRVVRLEAAADERGDGRHADDAAAGGRLRERHLASGRLGDVEGPVEVGAHRVVEQIRVEREEVGKRTHARVRHADVQPAPLTRVLHGRSDQLRGRRGIAHIASLMGETASGLGVVLAERLGLGDEGVEMGLVLGQAEVVDGDVGALTEEFETDGAADTRGAAGDDGGFVGEDANGEGHFVSFVLGLSKW